MRVASMGFGSALVLLSPLTSVADAVSDRIPFLGHLLPPFVRFDNSSAYPLINARQPRLEMLVIHGSVDSVVPQRFVWNYRLLVSRLGMALRLELDGCHFVGADGYGHDDILPFQEPFDDHVKKLLARVSSTRSE
jgi:hypothetical protein